STTDSTGTTNFVNLLYSYDAGGLPSVTNEYGHGILGTWVSTFTHDNLGRLTFWGTGICCSAFQVGVTYLYDSPGNLTSRSWGSPGGGGGTSYAITANPLGGYNRTATTGGSFVGGPGYTDTYQADLWGRTYDTPAVNITYNAVDEVTSLI